MRSSAEGAGWRIDRRVTLSALFSALSGFAIAAGMVAALHERVSGMEGETAQIREEMRETRRTALRVERMDERVQAMQHMLEEIRADLRRVWHEGGRP